MVRKRFTTTMKTQVNLQLVLKSHLLMDKTSKTELHQKTEFNNLFLTVWDVWNSVLRVMVTMV
ncbi:hypothetical protein D3C73_898370 [compost metagenome]